MLFTLFFVRAFCLFYHLTSRVSSGEKCSKRETNGNVAWNRGLESGFPNVVHSSTQNQVSEMPNA